LCDAQLRAATTAFLRAAIEFRTFVANADFDQCAEVFSGLLGEK
jgi:hypothetical protein